MPVALLYCEGGPKSPDIRILSRILTNVCTVRSSGGKYGCGERILISRDTTPNTMGLRDRDFDSDLTPPVESPRDWRVEGNAVHLGWTWERREIENYILDPIVVRNALGARAPAPSSYRTLLRETAESIANYTAARIALSLCRVRFKALSSSWGRPRGRGGHPLPDDCTEVACRNGIESVVNEHEQNQIVRSVDVLRRFDEELGTCKLEGLRLSHHLTYFAGKDLLYGMEIGLTALGFESPITFQERILKGIGDSSDDIWNWLPEWQRLRGLIAAY